MTIIIMKPKFPIKVLFNEDGKEWILNDEEDAACNLEWFDSEDPEEDAIVTDNLNRPVILRVVKLEIKRFELK